VTDSWTDKAVLHPTYTRCRAVIMCYARHDVTIALCVCLLVLELTTDVNIFVDPVSNRQALANKRYFRYLSLDTSNRRYLYAGAMYDLSTSLNSRSPL